MLFDNLNMGQLWYKGIVANLRALNLTAYLQRFQVIEVDVNMDLCSKDLPESFLQLLVNWWAPETDLLLFLFFLAHKIQIQTDS